MKPPAHNVTETGILDGTASRNPTRINTCLDELPAERPESEQATNVEFRILAPRATGIKRR